jgi:hypothetical protein
VQVKTIFNDSPKEVEKINCKNPERLGVQNSKVERFLATNLHLLAFCFHGPIFLVFIGKELHIYKREKKNQDSRKTQQFLQEPNISGYY